MQTSVSNQYIDCLETKGENMVSFRKIPGLELSEWDIYLNSRLKKEGFTYKGKTYKPSRECPNGETMRWQTIGFRRKVEEIGCMTEKEHEAYWRTAKQRKREKDSQALQKSIKDLQRVINPPTINCNSFGTSDGYNTTCTQY